MNQSQWVQARNLLSAADPRQPREAALQAGVGQPAGADHPVDADRIAGAEPRSQALGVVVRELVGDREGPHLHREEDDVAPLASAAAAPPAPSGPAATAATVTGVGIRRRRRSRGTATAAPTAPRAPARTARRSAFDGRERFLIGAASIGPSAWSGREPRARRLA